MKHDLHYEDKGGHTFWAWINNSTMNLLKSGNREQKTYDSLIQLEKIILNIVSASVSKEEAKLENDSNVSYLL